jgi:hypothetical protein
MMPPADQIDALLAPTGSTCSMIRDGAEPHPSVMNAIIRDVVHKHPQGGNSLERAVRLAVRLGWRARHQLQLNREEAKKP